MPNISEPWGSGGCAKTSIHEFGVKNIKGEYVNLSVYQGHVCIIVNVASKCGLTEINYKEFNELYKKYHEEKGLCILAFPCNQFGNDEPGTSKDIIDFTTKRNIEFDIFEKVDINGIHASPLWTFLKNKLKAESGKFIKGNFTKFIIDKYGIPVERHEPSVMPLSLIPSLELYW